MTAKLYLAIFFLSLLIGCTRSKEHRGTAAVDSVSYPFKYAQGFRVVLRGKNKWVEVLHPFQGAGSGIRYLLVQRGEPVPAHDPEVSVITIPLTTIVCTSTTHIPLLDYLGETEKLIGFPTTNSISSVKMRERIDAGKVKELGMDEGMNLELLVTLKPDLVMGYAMNQNLGQLKRIQELGIPAVVNAEYLETHPLGRAEWIKFMAIFFNKEQEADSIFTGIESEYNKIRDLTKTVNDGPSVMSGIVYGDAWFLPGGQNYASKLLDDAGCRYLWKTDPSTGFLELSFESVYERAKDADLWIGVGTFRSLREIKASEERYSRFKPFRNGQVYTYYERKGAKGGSEYLELGYLRPDLVLKDLVKIAHPDLVPEYDLFFYSKLK